MSKKDEQNHSYCNETIDLKNRIETDFLELADRLHRIRSLNLYRPAWDSFEEFCFELKNMSYSSVQRLIQIHETFVLKYKFAPARIAEAGGWTKIADILPLIRNKKDAEEWLDRAENTPNRQHLRESIKEARGEDRPDCKHAKAYVIRVCPDCGFKEHLVESPVHVSRRREKESV